MKRLVSLAPLSILLLLVACAGPQATPAATPSATVAPTSSPTETQTPTPEATATSASTLKIVTDEFDPEKLPTIDWSYATSEQFLLDLIQADKEGKIPHPSDKAIYLQPGDILLSYKESQSLMLKDYGFVTIFNIFGAYRFANEENRPYTLAGAWQSEFERTPMVVFVIRWQNSDGSAGYMAQYYSLEFAKVWEKEAIKTNFVIKNFLQVSTTVGVRGYISTGIYYLNQASCLKQESFGGQVNPLPVCEWYFANRNLSVPDLVLEHWKLTGILSNKIVNTEGNPQLILPILPASAQATGG